MGLSILTFSLIFDDFVLLSKWMLLIFTITAFKSIINTTRPRIDLHGMYTVITDIAHA